MTRRQARSCARQLVGLRRHDEVVLVEPFYLLGLPGDLCRSPSEADIRMVAFALGQVAEPDDEVHRIPEVPESETALDTATIVDQCPAGRLLQITLGLGP